jgi:NAD(P)-dependent dehydrogenase (short-subunit alcohol dehydrogenase family)
MSEAIGNAAPVSEALNMFDVRGKVVLVTGGSIGIGAMIAEGFVANGARVHIVSRTESEIVETAQRLSALGDCRPIVGDVSSVAGIEAIVSQLSAQETFVDVLVNNAGTAHMARLEEYDESGWDRTMNVNLKGAFFLTQRMLPLLRARATAVDPSRVLNIGSIDGLRPPPKNEHIFAYPASKAALHHMTRDLAQKLAPLITVNAIAPGAFDSRLNGPTIQEFGDAIIKATPCKRIGVLSDMAGTSIFLSSRAGSFVTGSILAVDGGIATTK